MAIATINTIALIDFTGSIEPIDLIVSQPNNFTLVIGPAGRMIPVKVSFFGGMARTHQPVGRSIRLNILQRTLLRGGARPAEKTKHDSFLQKDFSNVVISANTVHAPGMT